MSGTGWKRLLNSLQIRNDYDELPYGLKWRSHTLFLVSTVAIALFADLFLYGLIVPILPFMLQDRIGLPKEQVQSHVDGLLAAYAGSSVVFSPIAGIVADRMSSRQSPFLLGLSALFGATVLLAFEDSVPVLVVARILQGISAAFVWTIGLALCLETVGPENLGKTIGSIFSFISVGNLVSPLLGGILYEKAGYAGVFGIGFAVLVVDFIMRVLVIEKKVARRYYAKDPSVVSEQTSSEQQDNEDHEENGEEQPLLGSRKEDDAAFKLSENQPKIARLIPILPCLGDARLLTALLVAFIQAMLLGNFDATIPTVAQELFDFNSLKAGILFLPLGLFDLILGPLFGWIVDKYGTKPVAVVSYSYLVPVLVLLRLPHAGGKDQMILYGGLLALCGIGLAGIGAPSIVEAGAVVQKYYEVNPDFFGENGPYAQLYGLNSMVFSAGLTLGPELAGELKQIIGYGNMNIVLAAICAVTAALCFVYIGGKPRMFGKKPRLNNISPTTSYNPPTYPDTVITCTMVLENASQISEDVAFVDTDTPASDTDAYSSSRSFRSAFQVEVQPPPNQIIIPLDQLPRANTLLVSDAVNKGKLGELLQKHCQRAASLLGRPVRREEAEALSYNLANGMKLGAYGGPIGMSVGMLGWLRGYKTYRFPGGWSPGREKSRFVLDKFGAVTGPYARILWQSTRFTAYLGVWTILGQIFFTSYGLTTVLVRNAADVRLKDYNEALRLKAAASKAPVRDQDQVGTTQDETFEQRRQRRNVQENIQARQPMQPVQPVQKQQQRRPRDDASPTGGSFEAEFLSPVSESEMMNDAQTKQEEQRLWHTEPKEETKVAAPQKRPQQENALDSMNQDSDSTTTGGSAWDRLRQQAINDRSTSRESSRRD